ncbi:MAG: nitroreductase family protein, partial [Muribaculaceae bacterium]|nr:nitroreductase family protein [Muribaculaceae bacterium]
ERPAAYIIQCLDTKYGKDCLCDDGLQLEAITLGMRTLGLGGCIIKAFNAPKLAEILALDERYIPRYVLALGYPAEEVKIEDMSMDEDADFKYFRTPDGVHHVPKRPLEQLILMKS